MLSTSGRYRKNGDNDSDDNDDDDEDEDIQFYRLLTVSTVIFSQWKALKQLPNVKLLAQNNTMHFAVTFANLSDVIILKR